MKLLLDTHVLLWAAGEPGKLSQSARALLLDRENDLFFSAASLWEIVIKRAIGRSDFKADPVRLRRLLLANGYSVLPISAEHALGVERLPPLHKDPFDRILVSQARADGMRLVTVDEQVAKYGEGVLPV